MLRKGTPNYRSNTYTTYIFYIHKYYTPNRQDIMDYGVWTINLYKYLYKPGLVYRTIDGNQTKTGWNFSLHYAPSTTQIFLAI